MKKIWIITCMLIFCQITANSQPCLSDGITFSTQQQIDNFQTNYPNCTEIEGYMIIYGNGITNLSGLSVVTSIGGFLRIGFREYGNPNLTSLSGLEGLTSIGGDLLIYGNLALTSLTGLDNLSIINGDLYFGTSGMLGVSVGNPLLANLTGLANLASIGGDLSIRNTLVLTSLTGLEGLTSIGGNIYIGGNDALTGLTGLEGLTSIGGGLIIGGLSGGNPTLTSLEGLENVVSIGGSIYIWSTLSLTSLTGLDNVTSIGGDLSIKYNDFLSTCEVQSICNYLVNPNGNINIHDNAPGCNSQEEVEEACLNTMVEELNAIENHSIYPNPVTNEATFSSNKITSFELYDLMGVLIIRGKNKKVDMSNMNPGIYFVIGFDKNINPLYKGKIIKN